jgi:flavin-dependent dehydrogenase
VTAKALAHPEIFSQDLPRKDVENIVVYFGDRHSVTIPTEKPLAIVSRHELGRRLLDESIRTGVEFIRGRVTRVEKAPSDWTIATREREFRAEFLVGADGATSIVRRSLGNPLEPEDLAVTLGYFIPGDAPPQMKVFFVPALEGYIWSFPRPGHISYGLITRSGPAWTVRAKTLLANFIIADLGADAMGDAEPYSALVPCLRPASWPRNTVEGDRWALVGDAAGLTDPITGEGIHFAIQSAEALVRTIGTPGKYSKAVWDEMGRELARASRMYARFYRGRFMAGDFRKRVVQLSSRSRTLRAILGNFIAGEQPYTTLKKKLFFSAPRVGWELIFGR